MASQLYGVEPLDVPVWVIAVLAMLTAGFAAAVGPAMRASRVAPMTVLRAD
jgi:ABC-type lipoprotein release transport system permease subunit